MATLITKNSSTASAVPAAGDLVKGELAVNVTDKKVYTKDNSAAVVKLVGSLGNQEANAVAVTGGTINGTTIGATTPSTGAFTTASASSGFTGNLTGNVTGNVSGTAANVTGVVAIANGGTGLSALGTGVQSALGQAVTGSGSFVLSTSPSLTTPNLGTPSAAVLTNATGLPLTTGVTGTLGVANGGTGITAFGTGVATALGQNVTGSGGIVLATSPSLTTPNLGTPSAVTLTNATGLPISTGVSGLGTGVATALAINTGSSGAFVVNGGALGTPSSGTLTNATGLPLSTGVTGTLATTNGGTGLTSFTANGVVYASSSSALTTGSALNFNGTSLGVGISAASAYGVLAVSNGTNQLGTTFTSNAPTLIAVNNAGNAYVDFITDSSNQIFKISGTRVMDLTSTGLGIGTSSPNILSWNKATTLNVTSGNAAYEVAINGSAQAYFAADASNVYLAAYANKPLLIRTNNATVATFDASGNLGLGVTPSAWTVYKAFSVAGTGQGVAASAGGETHLLANTYYNAGWKYAATQGAARFSVGEGYNDFRWYTAPSWNGTGSNAISFTQALTLTAAANLLLGGTSDPGGEKALYIANTSSVPGTPTGGGVLYVEGGALKYKGSSGTVTTIANA